MISVTGSSKACERNLIPDICLALSEKMLQRTSLSKERVPKVLVLSLPETAFFKNACHPSWGSLKVNLFRDTSTSPQGRLHPTLLPLGRKMVNVDLCSSTLSLSTDKLINLFPKDIFIKCVCFPKKLCNIQSFSFLMLFEDVSPMLAPSPPPYCSLPERATVRFSTQMCHVGRKHDRIIDPT